MVKGEAAARLFWTFDNPMAEAMKRAKDGVPVVGITSNTVPREIVRAAGFFPVLLNARKGPTPNADLFMEPVFETRIRRIFDRLVAGDWSFLRLLIIPRTSQHEYKLYLYLREVIRQGLGSKVPPLYLYDLLHSRSSSSRHYGVARTKELGSRLWSLNERAADPDALAAAVEAYNAVRRTIQKLLGFRRSPNPRLSGTDALPLIGANYFMDPSEYVALAETAALNVAQQEPIRGPHVMVKGTTLDHIGLHRAIESVGAVVVAEDDWWGSRSVGQEVIAGPDPIVSIFEKYYLDAPSPRVFPPDSADEWFRREALQDIDGVVFYYPPEDDVFGWDFPRQKAFLQEKGIPSLLVREDLSEGGSPELYRSLEGFSAKLRKASG